MSPKLEIKNFPQIDPNDAIGTDGYLKNVYTFWANEVDLTELVPDSDAPFEMMIQGIGRVAAKHIVKVSPKSEAERGRVEFDHLVPENPKSLDRYRELNLFRDVFAGAGIDIGVSQADSLATMTLSTGDTKGSVDFVLNRGSLPQYVRVLAGMWLVAEPQMRKQIAQHGVALVREEEVGEDRRPQLLGTSGKYILEACWLASGEDQNQRLALANTQEEKTSLKVDAELPIFVLGPGPTR